MIQFHVYPGGKKRIVTFSYDDGPVDDKRIVKLFNKYSVKATFHIDSLKFADIDEEKKAELREIYKGHEISCHTLRHGWPARMPMQSVVGEIANDRIILENIFNMPVIGMSYPSGSYSDDAIKALQSCGIVYSRTVKSTGNFFLPEDFMRWHPSCHHKDALALCDKFLENIDSQWTHPLFYIWGHSFEFKTEDDWAYMEEVVKTLANNDKIWYATNIEIYNYMSAQSRLQISMDEKIIYNPSDISVWIEKNKEDIIEIPAGKTVYLAK